LWLIKAVRKKEVIRQGREGKESKEITWLIPCPYFVDRRVLQALLWTAKAGNRIIMLMK